jgi:hypothetical protein
MARIRVVEIERPDYVHRWRFAQGILAGRRELVLGIGWRAWRRSCGDERRIPQSHWIAFCAIVSGLKIRLRLVGACHCADQDLGAIL